jgi:murein DD-endopeptidase MepM/ murein hydrolase activator NlpD
MQLLWLPSPLADWRSFSITRRRLSMLAVLFAVVFLFLGNVLHFIGLRLAVEYRPELVRVLGGVMTTGDLQRLDETYRQRLETLRQEYANTGQQVAELRDLKDAFMQMTLPPASSRSPAAAPGRAAGTSAPAGDQEPMNPQLAAGRGGPLRNGTHGFDPARVISEELEGTNLFQDFDTSKKELRALKQWMRQARSDWSAQLAWTEAQPTGAPIGGPAQMVSRIGMRNDPFTNQLARHDGIDLAASPGTPILAAASGTVVRAQRHLQYGLMVDLDHGNGYLTRYAHASSLMVKPGEVVKRGAPIALVGSTGRSTGPHLHFEIHHKGSIYDPERFVSAALKRNATAGDSEPSRQ